VLRDARREQGVEVNLEIPLAFIKGLSCNQLLEPFRTNDFCATMPSSAMISFYRLPPGWIGGGRELILHFDEHGYCDGARWCFSQ